MCYLADDEDELVRFHLSPSIDRSVIPIVEIVTRIPPCRCRAVSMTECPISAFELLFEVLSATNRFASAPPVVGKERSASTDSSSRYVAGREARKVKHAASVHKVRTFSCRTKEVGTTEAPTATETEKSEQKGFANLVKGMFGTFRNVTGHAPKTTWPISEQDALDLLPLVSYIHRRIDAAANVPQVGRTSP